MRLQAGQTIGRYRLVEVIGEGGMGVVWKAADTDLQRPVALKFLTADSLARPDRRARFLREARTAAALNHPGICTIYEVGEFEQTPYIAMELIEGQTLDRRLGEAHALTLSELLRIGLRIAEGLGAAHARGIVHRDLKPANVMLTADGQVKILDFGLAKPQETDGQNAEPLETITKEMTREGTILGTVSYMSPEQAEGKPVDSRSDVFSFGIVLYQMATGEVPFKGETTTATLAKILEADPPAWSSPREGVPPGLERVLRRCLQKRADDRYNDTRDLVAELRNLRQTGETDAAVRPPETAAQPGHRRIPGWVSALVAGVVILGAVYLVGPRLFRGPEPRAGAATAGEAERPSVAVLPFQNLSADEENEYFSAGITEEIISKLSRIDDLAVASRGSVAQYANTDRDAQTIGAELGVRYLLEGSVRRAGGRVRISAQLVDSATGRNLWSDDFEGSLDDVFAMQEKTALAIAGQLDLQLSPAEQREVQRRSTDNVQAYDEYLQAEGLLKQWSDLDKLEAAREHYRRALEIDPDYVSAMAGLASVDAQIYRNFDTSEERIRNAEEIAARAAELAPDLPRAQLTLGEIAAMRYDYPRAERLIREAIRLDAKDALKWDYLSWVLAYRTPPDADGAVEAAEMALRLQHDFPGAYYHLGRGLLAQGRLEEARQAFEKSLELNPDFAAAYLGLAQYYLAVGEHQAALDAIEHSGRDSVMAKVYATLVYADLGKADQALESLEAALGLGFRDFPMLDATPYLAALRPTPRYRQLVERYR